IDDAQRPVNSPTDTRWLILPSLPTSRARRSSSRVKRWFDSMISLTVSATLPPTPVHLSGSRGAKLPCLSAVRTSSSLPWSTWSAGCWPCPFPRAGDSGVPRKRSDGTLAPVTTEPLDSPLFLISARSSLGGHERDPLGVTGRRPAGRSGIARPEQAPYHGGGLPNAPAATAAKGVTGRRRKRCPPVVSGELASCAPDSCRAPLPEIMYAYHLIAGDTHGTGAGWQAPAAVQTRPV